MSLRFGLFLVEQGLITCDQFCGLIKIQQQSAPSSSSIALQKNALSIRQVAKVYEALESMPQQGFLAAAQQLGFLDAITARQIQILQEWMVPSIESLIVDCELLTAGQLKMLKLHFDRTQQSETLETEDSQAASEPAAANTSEIRSPGFKPPQPKFVSRPVVVKSHEFVGEGAE